MLPASPPDQAPSPERSPEREHPKRDVLVFEHIPKTAGTTLRQVLHRRYQSGLFVFFRVSDPDPKLDQLARRIEAGRAPGAIISTMGYGFHERLPEPPEGPLRYTHFTFLRNPVERTISNYYYSLQIGEIHEGMSLVEFCSGDPEAIDPSRVANKQTAFLASRAWNYQTAFLSGLRARQILDGHPFRPEDYDEALLERAKRNLDAFLVPGLVERFDESLLLLGHALGWPLRALRFVEKNRGQRRPRELGFGREEHEALAAANALDLQLYRYAESRFEKLLDERLPDLDGRLRALGRMNRIYKPLVPMEYRLQQLKAQAHRALTAR